MGGGSLDKYHENMGMESNSVPTSSGQCGADDSNSTAESAGDSILQQLMQLCLSQEPDINNSTSLDSSGHSNGGGDWQEDVYQRIKTMKETYLPELNQLYQKIVTKLQQLESLPQQPKSEQLDKLKIIKRMLERNISFLQVSKTNILPTAAPLQQGQVPQSHMQAMPQQQSQISQLQSHENPMQMQSQQLNQQLQDLQVQQRQLRQKQNQITQSQLQQISQIMTETEPQNPLTSNFVGDIGGDWRSQMQASSRQIIVNKIMETLKIHLPFSGEEDLQRMATGYEETFYSAALSQSDYLRTISLKMLTIEKYSPRMPQLSYSNDWEEEVYQEIKTVKETYLPELNQMLQEIVTKLQQPMSDDQVVKLKKFKRVLEHLVSILQVTKTNILPYHKHWLGVCEWLSIHFLAIRPDPLANSQILQLFKTVSAKRRREQQLVEEVKKQKVEIQELKQTLVQMQQVQQPTS